jgi:hypothetical protein
MERSDDVRQGALRFYERFSGGDVEAFGAGLTREEGALVIGTDYTQWAAGREIWISAYRAQVEAIPGLRLEPGDMVAYAEGSLGWMADRPRVILPDGGELPCRLTGVLRQEDGEWKMVHCHLSFGVPDEKLGELASALFAGT